jgi:hypothetical protein
MQDFALPLRRAALIAWKGNTPLVALVPAASIYPGIVPAARTYPFVRYGSVTASPFRASGLNSSSFRFAGQAFTQGVKNTGGALLVTAEDHIYQIGSAMKAALDGATIDVGSGYRVRMEWLQTLPMLDGDDTSAWMTTVTFDAEVAG